MDPISLLILGGGAIAFAVTRKPASSTGKPLKKGEVSTKTQGNWTIKTDTTKTSKTQAKGGPSTKVGVSTAKPTGASRNYTSGNSSFSNQDYKNNTAENDYIANKAKKEWEKATTEAKKKACEALKNEYPNSSEIAALACGDVSYKQVATAIGAAAGAAACTSTGAGATVASLCGAIGAKVGKYLGAKTEEWANEAYEYGKAWASEGYDAAKDAASDAYDAVADSDYAPWNW